MGNASAAETIAVVPRKARRAGSMSWLESFDDIRDLLVRFVAALGWRLRDTSSTRRQGDRRMVEREEWSSGATRCWR